MFGRVPEWKRDRETQKVTLRDLRKSSFLMCDNGVGAGRLSRMKGRQPLQYRLTSRHRTCHNGLSSQ